jgi:hypothetical protein
MRDRLIITITDFNGSKHFNAAILNLGFSDKITLIPS